jgi:phosphatidylinositol alpha-mannosyltransferase
MRIALVAEDYYPQRGGVPEHVHHLARELRARGHSGTIITSHMRGAEADPPYERRVGTSMVIYANGGVSRITAGWRLTRRLVQIFRQERIDLVHVHGGLAPTFGWVAPWAAHRLGLPVVATFHSWFDRSLAAAVLRRPLQRLLNGHSANIAVSAAAVQAHTRYFHARWEIIPNGVDTAYFHPNGRAPAERSARGPQLLYLHRLEPRNHLGTLLDAMPRILQRYPEAQLMVAGDGPWRRYYQRTAAPLGPGVRFLGRISDPPEHYRGADLYLCPTTRASFGITLLEAMACGTPMIVADNPGFRSVLGGGAQAVMLPHDDSAAWAEAVIALMDDPARRQAMSQAGLAQVTRYAWPRVADEVLQVYQRVAR